MITEAIKALNDIEQAFDAVGNNRCLALVATLRVALLSALAALEAAGVRLVPVDPDDKMQAAGMESDSISHPWEALGVYRMMVSSSPYAPPGG